jgi:hypothetical protein
MLTYNLRFKNTFIIKIKKPKKKARPTGLANNLYGKLLILQ